MKSNKKLHKFTQKLTSARPKTKHELLLICDVFEVEVELLPRDGMRIYFVQVRELILDGERWDIGDFAWHAVQILRCDQRNSASLHKSDLDVALRHSTIALKENNAIELAFYDRDVLGVDCLAFGSFEVAFVSLQAALELLVFGVLGEELHKKLVGPVLISRDPDFMIDTRFREERELLPIAWRLDQRGRTEAFFFNLPVAFLLLFGDEFNLRFTLDCGQDRGQKLMIRDDVFDQRPFIQFQVNQVAGVALQ